MSLSYISKKQNLMDNDCIKPPTQSFMNHIMRSAVICTPHPILFG